MLMDEIPPSNLSAVVKSYALSASAVDNAVSYCFWASHDGVGMKLRRVGWSLGWVRRCALLGGRAAESVGRAHAVLNRPDALAGCKASQSGTSQGPKSFIWCVSLLMT